MLGKIPVAQGETMRRRAYIARLHRELPELVERGVVSAAAAAALRQYYGAQDTRSGKQLTLLVLGVVGAVLIGAGIMLLLAHNWAELSRQVRTVLSFLPLAIGQALVAWTLLKKPHSLAWREGSGSFETLAVGASISLIAQTYHMPGSVDSFLLAWMLLTLPVFYLLRAGLPFLMYLAGITAWAGYQQSIAGHALGYWILLLAALPFALGEIRRAVFSPRAAFLQWGLLVSVTVGIGIALEKSLPGLWMPIYASFLVSVYLLGGRWEDPSYSYWLQPLRIFGGVGALVLALLLTWRWPWRGIGWHHYRWGQYYHTTAAWADYLLGLGLLATAVGLLLTSRPERQADLSIAALLPVTLAGYALAAGLGDGADAAMILLNLYVLVVSLGLLLRGARQTSLLHLNGGLLMLAVLLLFRFFDAGLSFLARGLAFIVLGVVFLVCNMVMLRRQGRAA
jgi:uncharacterized membrane protein